MSLIIQLQRKSGVPLFRQIVGEIRKLIERGVLKPGDRLPPSRSFAETIGTDRSTVLNAYAELSALGFLSSRQGGYTTVAKRRAEALHCADQRAGVDWSMLVSQTVDSVCGSAWKNPSESMRPMSEQREQMFNMASIELDPRLYPVKDVRRCLGDVMAEAGSEALRYADPSGFPPLRSLLAMRLRLHGIWVSPQEILITNGAQQGLDLICRSLGGAGDCVIVEQPTYASMLPLLRLNGLQTVGIPMSDSGADIEALSGMLQSHKPAFLYTMPSFHNPTGLTTTHGHRERLLDLAIQKNIPIVEDGFEDDMRYEGPVAMPVKSIDDRGIVVYLGTFSKALFPGLRVGWIAAGRSLVERLAVVKRYTDLATNTLGQMLLDRFCREGFYDRHLQRVHRLFRRRMAAAMEAAGRYFPPEVTWTRPAGGYTIWLKLPRPIEAEDLQQRTRAVGVWVSPGGLYFQQEGPSPYVRISIARLNEKEIDSAFARLGGVWRDLDGAP